MRYPEARSIYTKKVARTRELQLRRIFENNGFLVRTNPFSKSKCDLELYSKEDVHYKTRLVVIEVTNENLGSFYDSKWVKQKISLFRRFKKNPKMLKFLICSFRSSFKDIDKLEYSSGCYAIELGFQVLPESYYNFWKKKNLVQYRRPDDSESYDLTKEKIESFLKQNSILMVNHEKT
jgi:hypothetical protein